jgi:hypothetical protein
VTENASQLAAISREVIDNAGRAGAKMATRTLAAIEAYIASERLIGAEASVVRGVVVGAILGTLETALDEAPPGPAKLIADVALGVRARARAVRERRDGAGLVVTDRMPEGGGS